MKRTIWTFLLILLAATAVDAHGVRTETIGADKIRFSYDDGSPLSRAYITVYDAGDQEIATATADNDGVFDISVYPDAAKISAADVFGHRGEYDIRQPAPPKQTHWSAVVGVAVVLVAIAALFHWAGRQRRKQVCAGVKE